MITTDSITKLNTSVVYVARGPSDPTFMLGVDPSILNDIVDAPDILPSANGAVLSSMRSQLTVAIDFNNNRLEFSDRSTQIPNRADFPARVAMATQYISKQINQSYAVIGFNYEIEWHSEGIERSSSTILEKVVKHDVLKQPLHNVLGASARLWYVLHDKNCDLRIEPRGNQFDAPTFYANLNVYTNLDSEVPSEEWLSQALKQEYQDFLRVLSDILSPG